MSLQALIDGDILLYRAGFAAEKTVREVDGGGNKITRTDIAPVENAIDAFESMLDYIMVQTGADDYMFYISGDKNFRKDIATILPYKGNRKYTRPPVHYQALLGHAHKNHPTQLVDGQEADDELGIQLTRQGKNAMLVSIDKDLLMVPGQHFNFVKNKMGTITEPMANRIFWTQMLVGDPSDNVPGCPNIGKARAKKAMEGAEGDIQMWRRVKRVFREQFTKECAKPADKRKGPEGFDFDGQFVTYKTWRTGAQMEKSLEDYLLEIGRLLWIRREPMQLWLPPLGD